MLCPFPLTVRALALEAALRVDALVVARRRPLRALVQVHAPERDERGQ